MQGTLGYGYTILSNHNDCNILIFISWILLIFWKILWLYWAVLQMRLILHTYQVQNITSLKVIKLQAWAKFLKNCTDWGYVLIKCMLNMYKIEEHLYSIFLTSYTNLNISWDLFDKRKRPLNLVVNRLPCSLKRTWNFENFFSVKLNINVSCRIIRKCKL